MEFDSDREALAALVEALSYPGALTAPETARAALCHLLTTEDA